MDNSIRKAERYLWDGESINYCTFFVDGGSNIFRARLVRVIRVYDISIYLNILFCSYTDLWIIYPISWMGKIILATIIECFN